jgi:phage-related protein (TIGR01555 family)
MSTFEQLFAVGRIIHDSWFNPFTGYGTGRDKTEHTSFIGRPPLADVLLTDLFNHDDISRKVVGLAPSEMFREGYLLDGTNNQNVKLIEQRGNALNICAAFENGLTWARLYGGSVIFVGADDGLSPTEPLVPAYVKAVDFLDVYDRRRVWPHRFCQDPRNPNYGRPEIYSLQSFEGHTAYVHASRLIMFRGAKTDDFTRRQLNDWDYSVLQNTYDTIQHFNECFRASRIMMSEASVGVFTMKGLLAMIAGGQRDLLNARAQMLDMSKSVARSIFLDAGEGENYRRESIPFGGVAEQLIQAAKRLSAATDPQIPVIVLMGETPSGLNASGNANVRLWYDQLKSLQIKEVIPKMLRVYQLIAQALGFQNEDLTLIPKPLWQETPNEREDRRLKVSQRDQACIASEIFTPEEVAAVRGTPGGYEKEIAIDPRNRLGTFADPELGP